MAKTLRATFAYPAARVGGSALDPAVIAGCDIALRTVGAPSFTPVPGPAVGQPTVPYPGEEFVQTELDVGSYEIQFVCVLTDGQRSTTPVVRAFTVSDDSPPGPIANVTLTIE